jgi:hypothetical protein
VYAAVQQNYRSSANDPQLQIATEDALRLDAGASPNHVAGGPPVDLARSLGIHVSVYDESGRVTVSTARLDGAIPTVPVGALKSAQRQGQNTITWQPRSGVRVAAVIVRWRGGTVLVGRSLVPIENRENDLLHVVAILWFVGLPVLAGAALLAAYLWPDRDTQKAESIHLQAG